MRCIVTPMEYRLGLGGIADARRAKIVERAAIAVCRYGPSMLPSATSLAS